MPTIIWRPNISILLLIGFLIYQSTLPSLSVFEPCSTGLLRVLDSFDIMGHIIFFQPYHKRHYNNMFLNLYFFISYFAFGNNGYLFRIFIKGLRSLYPAPAVAVILSFSNVPNNLLVFESKSSTLSPTFLSEYFSLSIALLIQRIWFGFEAKLVSEKVFQVFKKAGLLFA